MAIKKSLSAYTRGEIGLIVLQCCVAGIAIGAVLVCPNLAQLYKFFSARTLSEQQRIRRNVTNLQKRGYLKESIDWGGQFKPTVRGIRQAEYDSLQIKRQTKWDGKWRLCMFDIPEVNKASRVSFSIKVGQMGMRHYQKSIYISPYPCETELQKVTNHLGVTKYVRIITASRISDQIAFEKVFSL